MSELVQEAIVGQEAYKRALIEEFQDVVSPLDLAEVKARLADEGLVVRSPFVTIPYDSERLERASQLRQEYPWCDPATVFCIDRERARYRRGAEGVAFKETGSPVPFWTALINTVVIFDDALAATEAFGAVCAEARATTRAAHEGAHAALASLLSVRHRQVDEHRVEADVTCNIGHTNTKLLLPWDGNLPANKPVWIDEAFAGQVATRIRCAMNPASIPKESKFIRSDDPDIDGIEIPREYIIASDSSSDLFQVSAGIESVGLDMLADKRPWLLPSIKALAIGRLGIEAFHAGLCNQVGAELYRAITEPQPQSTWGKVFVQIENLS